MEEQIISLEAAKLAKEKGFDENTWNAYGKTLFHGSYDDGPIKWNSDVDFGGEYMFAAPAQSLLQKWLRDKHDIILLPIFHDEYGVYGCRLVDIESTGFESYFVTSSRHVKTYELAMEAGLIEALKLIVL